MTFPAAVQAPTWPLVMTQEAAAGEVSPVPVLLMVMVGADGSSRSRRYS